MCNNQFDLIPFPLSTLMAFMYHKVLRAMTLSIHPRRNKVHWEYRRFSVNLLAVSMGRECWHFLEDR